MFTNISSEKRQRLLEEDASKRLSETHNRELQEYGYVRGVDVDWGDDPDDFEMIRPYDITKEIWYATYKLGECVDE